MHFRRVGNAFSTDHYVGMTAGQPESSHSTIPSIPAIARHHRMREVIRPGKYGVLTYLGKPSISVYMDSASLIAKRLEPLLQPIPALQ